MGQVAEMLVALACVLGTSSLSVCTCPRPGPQPPPDAMVVVATTTALPDAQGGPAEAGLLWKAVVSLDPLEGSWGSKTAEEGWAELSSRDKTLENGGKWEYPYPWHVLVHPPGQPSTYDCGVHELLMDDGKTEPWRVAYCEGGDLPPGRRHAKRLVLMLADTDQGLLRIDVEGLAVVELDRN